MKRRLEKTFIDVKFQVQIYPDLDVNVFSLSIKHHKYGIISQNTDVKVQEHFDVNFLS